MGTRVDRGGSHARSCASAGGLRSAIRHSPSGEIPQGSNRSPTAARVSPPGETTALVVDELLLLWHGWGRHSGNRQALRGDSERQVEHGAEMCLPVSGLPDKRARTDSGPYLWLCALRLQLVAT